MARVPRLNLGELTDRDPLLHLGLLDRDAQAQLRESFTDLTRGPTRLGLCHGDLSLKNVIVDDGSVQVIDWGCAHGHLVPHYDLGVILAESLVEHSPEFVALLDGYGLYVEARAGRLSCHARPSACRAAVPRGSKLVTGRSAGRAWPTGRPSPGTGGSRPEPGAGPPFHLRPTAHGWRRERSERSPRRARRRAALDAVPPSRPAARGSWCARRSAFARTERPSSASERPGRHGDRRRRRGCPYLATSSRGPIPPTGLEPVLRA